MAHPNGARKIGRSSYPDRRKGQHEQRIGSSLVGEAIFECASPIEAEKAVIAALAEFRVDEMGLEWFLVDYETAVAAVSSATKTEPLPFGSSDIKSTVVTVFLDAARFAALENWRSKQPRIPSRSEAIRILVDWALEQGGP
jgi:hypothetical protein